MHANHKLVAAVVFSIPILANADVINGRVVEYGTENGISDVTVTMRDVARDVDVEGGSAITDSSGYYTITFDFDPPVYAFRLRFEPENDDSHYVGGRWSVDWSSRSMDVDTFGLVSKSSNTEQSADKQQKDGATYEKAGGDPGRVRLDIEFARNHYSSNGIDYNQILEGQPNWVQRPLLNN